MSKKSRLYTAKGDKGTTSLVGGQRVSKGDQRLVSYGTVDELNSLIGILLAEEMPESDRGLFVMIQNALFVIGSDLATLPEDISVKQRFALPESVVHQLESAIDEYDASLPPMKGFILPGGGRMASTAHLARTVCRRAEREIVRLMDLVPEEERALTIAEPNMRFMNRLSDLLFVYARMAAHRSGEPEVLWSPNCFSE